MLSQYGDHKKMHLLYGGNWNKIQSLHWQDLTKIPATVCLNGDHSKIVTICKYYNKIQLLYRMGT